PLPIDVKDGRAAGLYAKGEFVGFATVATATEADANAADFVFHLLNYSISQQVDRDNLQFNIEYLKNLINLMQNMSQKTAAVFDREKVAEFFICECEKLFGARSGAVIVFENGRSNVLANFGTKFTEMPAVQHVMAIRKIYVNNNPSDDAMYEGITPPHNVLVVPMLAGTELVGAIYLRDKEIGPFTIEDQRMSQTLATVLGGTIANIQLHQSLVATERVKSTLSRYLSPNLLKEIVETGRFEKLGGERVRTTILFTDIRGFTKLSEQMSPEQMVSQLNEYFEEMSQVIFKYDGTLDKYVGDLVMVLFGVPKSMTDASARAIRTAIEMQKRIKVLNRKWTAEGKPNFGVGMGINTGDVIFGNIGSSQAMGLTVIGDNVNCAQRLEAYASAGEILISEAVQAEVGENGFKLARLGLLEVKGKQIVAYRVEYD
ncbi:MAG: GAF domain-containing protein, partial [Deltaproteobacteria bacterium]|nr:GAF domain-containing protein [Deltaproteobacteria bacterium]